MNKLIEGTTAGLGVGRRDKMSDNKVKDNRKEILEACKSKILHEKMSHLYSFAV